MSDYTMPTTAEPLDLSEPLLPWEMMVVDETELFNAGYAAYYHGVRRSDLATEAEQRGWDDAHGSEQYCRAMLEEAKYVDECQGEYSDWRWA